MRRAIVLAAIAACAQPQSSPSPSPSTNASLSPSPPSPSPSPSLAVSPSTPPALSHGPEHWCTDGVDALDDETCFVVPDAIAEPRALLVYLHGVIAPTGRTQRVVQSIVASRARARGFVAMLPRGRRGIGPKKLEDWWAWPTSADAHRRYARAMTDAWWKKRALLEERLGAAFERVYLAGSSNGAYFVSILALRGEVDVDGFGAMSGGGVAGKSAQTVARAPRPPFYVGWGANDDTHDDPKALAALLKRAAWPSRAAEHPVGHGAREVYLDEAFDFWSAR
jgi:poly(3-hydroxybutyrate) depolymerase